MDGWGRVGQSVEHAVVYTLGVAVAAGGLIGYAIGFGVEKLRHRHRQPR